MKKALVSISISLVLVFTLGLMGVVSASTFVLNLNTVAGPEQAQVKGYEAAREYILQETNGEVEIRIFHSGLLGEAADVVLDVREGATDISIISPTWMMEYYGPAAALEAPYVALDYEHLYQTLDSELGKDLFSKFEETTNTIILDSWYFGTRHVFSTRRATTPEEFRGMIFRVPDSPIFFESAEVLGASPTPLPIGEVYLGFQTGAIQATFFPFGDAYALGFHEVTDYVIMTGDVVYSIQPIVHVEKWNEIPQEYQEIILEGFQVGKEVNNQIVLEAEGTKADVFREHGLEVIEPDLAPFIDRASSLWEKYGWTELVEQIDALKD